MARDVGISKNQLLAELRKMELDLITRAEEAGELGSEFVRGARTTLKMLVQAVEAVR